MNIGLETSRRSSQCWCTSTAVEGVEDLQLQDPKTLRATCCMVHIAWVSTRCDILHSHTDCKTVDDNNEEEPVLVPAHLQLFN